MGSTKQWPEWLAVPTASVGDLLALASLRFDLDLDRFPAGVIEAVSWILETGPAPGTGREASPHVREVVVAELCAAELHALEGTDEPAPPLARVCADLRVPYRPARTGDPQFGLGAWATLDWAMGNTRTPPMRLPLRDLDGHLLGEAQILASLLRSGLIRSDAVVEARHMVEDSRRLAALVRLRTASPAA